LKLKPESETNIVKEHDMHIKASSDESSFQRYVAMGPLKASHHVAKLDVNFFILPALHN
jgi:hypothetical protein